MLELNTASIKKIGNNSIVGAASFVNKDVEDNTVVYGVPAKFIRPNDGRSYI